MERARPTDRSGSTRATAMVVTVLALAVLAVAATVIVTTTEAAGDRARAQTAADAAALAGVTGDRAAAADLAARNGAQLRRFERRAERVSVVVELGAAVAEAEAEVAWRWVDAG